MNLITKRDGSLRPYEQKRISDAMDKAFDETVRKGNVIDLVKDRNILEKVKKSVFGELEKIFLFEKNNNISIDKIQEIIETNLMGSDLKSVARSFIEYRRIRDLKREKNTKLYKDIVGIVEQTNVEVLNENANKDSRIIPTQRDLLAGTIAKNYARNHLLPFEIVNAHDRGIIHYHDLDYAPFFPMTNCCLIDLENMLTNGFKMGSAQIESPKSISTAAAVTVQIIAQVSSHQYGGTSINRIDEVLEKYVTLSYEKSKKKAEALVKDCNIKDENFVETFAKREIEKEVYDAFQGLEYEINTLHTSNGQTPFITFGFGLGESWQSKLIQKAILENRMQGLGKKRKTAIFPKLVFTIKDGLNGEKGDPNYDIKQLALKCASERMYPDILSYEKVVEVTGSFKAPMGCRSFLAPWVDPETGKEKHSGRNNLGVVTLNLPRIAIETENEKAFFELLEERLLIAKKALMTRIERLSTVKASVAPILYCEGAFGVRLKPDDYIIDLFKNGRSSISLGFIGLHETSIALMGKDTIPFKSSYAQDLSKKIVSRLNDACEEWKEETGYGFSLYSTPSENLCDRFCNLDLREFGEIEGVNDKGYYTNSFHLDVREEVNAYDKIDFEMDYPALTSGGFISFAEFPNMRNNLEALENVWDYARKRTPYFGTNTPVDECYECDYKGEFNATSKGFVCPNCGNHDEDKVSVIRRVCGYLGAPNSIAFNAGKQSEVQKRTKHLE